MTPAAARAQTAPPLAPRRRVAAPTRPRRISGPAAPTRTARPQGPSAEGGLALGVIGRLDALASHRLLDRLIRSRVWIGIVAFALIGIVTLQLGLLKLNSGIGRALEREGSLQRENAALAVENSELASGSRVESQAEQLGMRLASIAGLKFLGSHGRGDVAGAAAALQAAPAHEALAPASEAGAPEGETSSAPSAEASSESPAGEEAVSSASESSAASEAGASGTPSAEGAAQSAGGSGEVSQPSEASSEQVPAGEGGGAAAPAG